MKENVKENMGSTISDNSNYYYLV